MAAPSFRSITPIDPFKGLAGTAGGAANYFFGQAQALQQAKQQEVSNKLAQQRLAEDARINDSTIAAREFDLKQATAAAESKERIKDTIARVAKNADKHVRNYALAGRPEYLQKAGETMSNAYRAFAKKQGRTLESAPAVTASEGTEEYQKQKAARDHWFTQTSEIGDKFAAEARPLVESAFLDRAVVDKDTAKAALRKRLLSEGVPVDRASSVTDVLSAGYTDYGAANTAARTASTKAAEGTTKLAQVLSRLLVKPTSSGGGGSSASRQRSSTKTPEPSSAVKYLEDEGMTFQDGAFDLWDSSTTPIHKSIEALMERKYSYEQANGIAIKAALLAKKDNSNLDVDEFTRLVGVVANQTPKQASAGSTANRSHVDTVAARNRPVLQGVTNLVNSSLRRINAAAGGSPGLHTKVLQGKLASLQQFADKYSSVSTPKRASTGGSARVKNRPLPNPNHPLVGNRTPHPATGQATTVSSSRFKAPTVGDGTANGLAMSALQNPKTWEDLSKYLKLRTAATNENDPTKAVALHNQVSQQSHRFKGADAIPNEQIKRILEGVTKFRSGGVGSVQQTYSQLLNQVKNAGGTIQSNEQEINKLNAAYEATNDPKFIQRAEQLKLQVAGLQKNQQLWQGLLKGSTDSFLSSISNNK